MFPIKRKNRKNPKTSLRSSSPSDPVVALSPGKIPRTLKRVVAITMRQQDVGSQSHIEKIPCMKT